jgi:hypothetical protein
MEEMTTTTTTSMRMKMWETEWMLRRSIYIIRKTNKFSKAFWIGGI